MISDECKAMFALGTTLSISTDLKQIIELDSIHIESIHFRA